MCCFINFTLKIATLFFYSNKEYSVGHSLIRWDRNVWRKLTWKWHQDVKNDIKTSKSSSLRHARESSYTPSCKTIFPGPGWVHGNIGRVCKNIFSGPLRSISSFSVIPNIQLSVLKVSSATFSTASPLIRIWYFHIYVFSLFFKDPFHKICLQQPLAHKSAYIDWTIIDKDRTISNYFKIHF